MKRILIIGVKLIDIITGLAKTSRAFSFQHRWFFNDVTLWTDTFVKFKSQDSIFYWKFRVLEGTRKKQQRSSSPCFFSFASHAC